MAHELEFDTTGKANMAFVGELPWHKLGTQLDSLATATDMITAAGLGWTTSTDACFERHGNPIDGYAYVASDEFVFIKRDDTGKVLGTATKGYVPFNNADAFKLLDEFTLDPGGPKYVTSGSLSGGKRTWALAKMPESFDVLPGDTISTYMLASTGHDGKTALRVLGTNIRVVCANTERMALANDRGFRWLHNGQKPSGHDVRMALGYFDKFAQESKELFQHLARTQVTDAQVEITLRALFGEASVDAKRDRSGAKVAKVKELMEVGRGTDIPGVRGTAWGLFNAVTEFNDHYHGATSKSPTANDRRVESMWFGGTIEKRRDTALQLLTAIK